MASYFPNGGNLTGSNAPTPIVSTLGVANLYPVTADARGIFIGTAAPVAPATDCVSLGFGALATNTDAIAIGTGARADGSGAIAAGAATLASGASCIAIGYNSVATSGAIAVGATANAQHVGATVVGQGASSGADRTTVVGHTSTAPAYESTVIGYNTTSGTVAGGSAGLAITVPADTVAAGAPGAANNKLYIMLRGVRYAIPLTTI